MKFRYRILIAFVVLTGGGIYYLVDWVRKDLRPRYLEAVEESLVDTANLLAEWLAARWGNEGPDKKELEQVFEGLQARSFEAVIYGLRKTRVDLRLYVTDTSGKVIFDSDGRRDEGKDFSQWRDVNRTLRGGYGARSTRVDSDDPGSSVLYVAAPVRRTGSFVGVVTVAKPTGSVNLFLEAARAKVLGAGVLAALGVALAGLLLSYWVTGPLGALTRYALAVRDGKSAARPKRLRGEIKELADAYEEMREALEGRKYVETYVQSLTHALKSPLSGIQGAAELLSEDLPDEARRRFAGNIRQEGGRMREIVDRMLELAGLESRHSLVRRSMVNLNEMIEELRAVLFPLLEEKHLRLEVLGTASLESEPVLLRTALLNLLENAVDFSPGGGRIEIQLDREGGRIKIVVRDEGPGVPDYALERIGEKFYSLPRPDAGRKGTGLGLSWVKEVTRLHGGSLELKNRTPRGFEAIWSLPAEP